MDRRELVTAGVLAAATRFPLPPAARPPLPPAAGRLRQSVCRWTYNRMPLRELCGAGRGLGLAGIDLLPPAEWGTVREEGLVCSMGYPGPERRDFIAAGFNDPAHHEMLLAELMSAIPAAAEAGVPNVIAMFGNRNGRSDEDAIANCVAGLNRIRTLAEQRGVTICLELLNSKVDHQDYQGDRTSFGVQVVRAVGSPRVKLLYDIYHMQIMEGDVIRTIRDNIQWIGHFHTGGVPGRHEIDDSQELNYRAIARAIADAGYGGFVAHEFVPTGDPLSSLRDAVRICSV